MKSDLVYLKIGNTVFSDDFVPDAVVPKTELISNSERSLDGTMNIDIIARKVSVEASWSMLSAKNMAVLNNISNLTENVRVTYIVADDNTDEHTTKTITAYVEDLTYTPFFIGDRLQWKDVTLKLTEI